jgi:membrane dipeptidase
MNRRQLLEAALAAPFALCGNAFAKDPIFIGDMHFHLLFVGPNPAPTQPLARNMASGKATLVSWSLVGDLPWMGITPKGFKQKAVPKAGEPVAWLKKEMERVQAHLTEQKLKVARTPEDVDRAVAGEPHVVLSVEGASFLDDGIAHLQTAYDLGVRNIQLVHYIRNTVGDFQTERPQFGGLTDFGKTVVQECNRLGILVDLAHSPAQSVTQALAVSTVPMIWSHSSVTRTGTPAWTMPAVQARQLGLEQAKAIAAKGGVIGLWAVRSDAGRTPEAYGDKLSEMADWLGEDHAAFGTDMNGLILPVLANYADVRRVVDHWERKRMKETRIRKLAIGNYARVLKQAMAARKA